MAPNIGHNSGEEEMSDINQTLTSIHSQLSSIDSKLDDRVKNVTFYWVAGIVVTGVVSSFFSLNSQINMLTSKFDVLHGQLIGSGTIGTPAIANTNTDNLLYTVSK